MKKIKQVLLSAIGLILVSTILTSTTTIFAEESAAPVKKTVHRKKNLKKKVIKKAPTQTDPSTTKKTDSTPESTASSPTTPGSKLSPDMQAWLKKLKEKLVRTQAKEHQLVAVAAVRGDETKDATPLYWKGNKSEGEVKSPELTEFNEAVELALKGNDLEAKTKLEAFVQNNPNSPLKDDAKETLEKLNKSQTQ